MVHINYLSISPTDFYRYKLKIFNPFPYKPLVTLLFQLISSHNGLAGNFLTGTSEGKFEYIDAKSKAMHV